MKKILLFLIVSSTLIFSAASCEEDPIPGGLDEDKNLSGSISDTRTLDASVEYLLVGPLLVEDGGVLNIPAGTTIKAKKGFSSYILVLQGGKINVNGTAEKPVTMTADIPNAEQGYWGGLIINGRAPSLILRKKVLQRSTLHTSTVVISPTTIQVPLLI